MEIRISIRRFFLYFFAEMVLDILRGTKIKFDQNVFQKLKFQELREKNPVKESG